MASALIHIAVAKKINEHLHMDEKQLFLGSIAPDLSKQIGLSKQISHFQDGLKQNDFPNLKNFLKKYEADLHHPFFMGYYIHLYTDYLWFKYFITEIIEPNAIRLLNGKIISCSPLKQTEYIYHDYTNLNIQLLDDYALDLSLFYDPVELPNCNMEELPIDKLQILLDKMGIIIKNSKSEKAYTFDIKSIHQFISLCEKIITSDIQERMKKEGINN